MYGCHQPRVDGVDISVVSCSIVSFVFVVLRDDFFVVDFDAVFLQTVKPSCQVCSNLASPGAPHLPRHDPPLPQHVGPALVSAHLGHSERIVSNGSLCIGIFKGIYMHIYFL